MTRYYSKLLAICVFAVLQCFAPLLHAHFDTTAHDLSGVHQHEAVELYCLDGEKSHCPEARIELGTQAVTATLALSKKLSDSADSGLPPFSFSPGQTQVCLAASSPPSLAVPRWHFALPPAHAPPYIL